MTGYANHWPTGALEAEARERNIEALSGEDDGQRKATARVSLGRHSVRDSGQLPGVAGHLKPDLTVAQLDKFAGAQTDMQAATAM
jgi:hypothetical protein